MSDLHHICTTEPGCLCSESGEECCCAKADREAHKTHCTRCGAPMRAIDFDTGEPLSAGRTSSYDHGCAS